MFYSCRYYYVYCLNKKRQKKGNASRLWHVCNQKRLSLVSSTIVRKSWKTIPKKYDEESEEIEERNVKS